MNLTRLAGNGPLKRQLELETARRGLSHAYILSGPAGSGKRTLAGLLAAALVCTGGGERPCLSCPGCRKALAGIHPDIVRAGDDGRTSPWPRCASSGPTPTSGPMRPTGRSTSWKMPRP